MIKSDGLKASEYEFLLAPGGARADGYSNNKFYAIVGEPGIWRRVSDPKGDPARVGVVPVWFGGGVIYLKYDLKAATDLDDGGYVFPSNKTISPMVAAAIDYVIKLHYAKTSNDPAGLVATSSQEIDRIKAGDEEAARADKPLAIFTGADDVTVRIEIDSVKIADAIMDAVTNISDGQPLPEKPSAPSLLDAFKQQQANLDAKKQAAQTAHVAGSGTIKPLGTLFRPQTPKDPARIASPAPTEAVPSPTPGGDTQL